MRRLPKFSKWPSPKSKWLSITEVAALVGFMPPRKVRTFINKGILPARKVAANGPKWAVRRDNAEKFAQDIKSGKLYFPADCRREPCRFVLCWMHPVMETAIKELKKSGRIETMKGEINNELRKIFTEGKVIPNLPWGRSNMNIEVYVDFQPKMDKMILDLLAKNYNQIVRYAISRIIEREYEASVMELIEG